MRPETIEDYHAAQAPDDRAICDLLRQEIERGLPDAESKLWHAHPVWFLAGNPIVGYSKLKACVRLLFWSGRSFNTPGLAPEGTFQAAEMRFTAVDRIDIPTLRACLEEARRVRWDYRNIVKRKGRLERIS